MERTADILLDTGKLLLGFYLVSTIRYWINRKYR